MSLVNTTPWSLINHLNRDRNEAIRFLNGTGSTEDHWWPKVDIIEDAGNFVVLLDVPGVDPQTIEVTTEGNILSVSGKRDGERQGEKTSTRIRERAAGEFRRSFRLPEGVDTNAIAANGKHGVLEILIPMKAEVQPRQIPVTH
jgi:HSP20 family protein